ncbi:uncharacterized protein FA14DRAFT_160202 [Meira miltonrushii]|uniref:BTB domain-containing protein n=1 Tax=Meira miltonrushii TaxID=1280837 RepID=A0A316VEJ1_9BASI|nr:uncharacterized protein FA14DRAFT_160202 [Meira miltonrushii]PWN34713.1 hypothetical protein FA14DRAFT_160202 [Meira miltonrushii]
MSTSDRSKGNPRKVEMPVPNEPKETNSIIFEWPLRGLKEMFDSSKSDAKSKVIKSTPFGGGRWTVLFYAQSGHDQFCSLYLNAEPLPHERIHPLLGNASPNVDNVRGSAIGSSSKSKGETGLEERWARKGLFRFTFNIQVIEDRTVLGNKEAYDHAFSHKTSNWGWAQFAKRDAVYYKNPEVIREDGLLITVTITSSPEKPKMAEPISHTVPPILVQAMGSLLDDPEHSDVVFHLHPSRRRAKSSRSGIRKVYAIRKILAARSDYFRLMFEGGFQEAEAEESSDEEEAAGPLRNSAAHTDSAAKAGSRGGYEVGDDEDYGNEEDEEEEEEYDEDEEEEDDDQSPICEDSDEDFEEDRLSNLSPYHSRVHTPAESSQRDFAGSGCNSPNEDDEAGSSQLRIRDDAFKNVANDRETGKVALRSSNRLRTGDFSRSIENISHEERGSDSPFNDEEASSTNAKAALAQSSPKNGKADGTTATTKTLLQKRSRSGMNDTVSKQSQANEGKSEHDRRKRRKVNVIDSAYPTFKALLYFLYTDTIEFAPLTSSFLPADVTADTGSNNLLSSSGRSRRRGDVGSLVEEMAKAHRRRKAVIETYCERNPGKPSPCSAKAMYRLADKLDIPDLKKRAQEHIAMSLTVHNIVWETFSGYNTQFPDICDMEIDFLLKHWSQVKRSNAIKSIFQRSNNLPGIELVLPKLLERLDYRPPDVDENEEGSYS